MMKRVLILVEGQTEETFVRDLLNPSLAPHDLYLIPTLVKTKRVKSGPDFKGGVTQYSHVRKDLVRLLQDTNATAGTTMLDFYGLPSGFPGFDKCPR